MLKNRYLVWKNIINLTVMVVGTLVVITLLTGMQNGLSRQRSQSLSRQILADVDTTLRASQGDAA